MNWVEAPHCVLAVDPGLSGAVCKLGRGCFEVRRDFLGWQAIPSAIRELAPGSTHAIMEFVHAYPGQGVTSMFNFGKAAGVASGAILAVLPGIFLDEVRPEDWQQHFRTVQKIPTGKEFSSVGVASTLLPAAQPYLKRVKDHNTADAILMAIYKLNRLRDSGY